jgi:ATP-dependent Clp protease protease subunit
MDGIWLYTKYANSDNPVMLIDKHIGFDEVDGFGIMGDLFQKELLALDEMQPKRITVWINSLGGNVVDGMNIYNAILNSKTPVDTFNTGVAASMAAVIFQAGRKRIMADYSKLMYHNPYGSDDNKSLNALKDSILKMVCSRTGKEEGEVTTMMNRTTWIGAEEAKQIGFCDDVQATEDANRKYLPKASEAKAMWKEAAVIVNKYFDLNNSNTSTMKNIANKLNLNPEASETAIAEAIESVQNKVRTQDSEIQTHLASIKAKDDELAKAKAALEEAKNKVAALEKEAEDAKAAKAKAEEESKTKAALEEAAKAKNMIDGFVAEGRIKNDEAVKNEWIENCKVLGIDKVKNMIESLPVNRKSVKIVEDIKNQATQYSFAGAMVNITNKQKA